MKFTPLPRTSHLYIPFVGTLLTRKAIELCRQSHPQLLGEKSSWKIIELIKGQLWLSRLRGENDAR